MYFENEDSTNCYDLKDHLNNARIEELKEITLLEAVPDNDNSDYIWCTYLGEVGERGECRKSFCAYYESKSGRGVCSHRGNLFLHGDAINFNVETGKEIK